MLTVKTSFDSIFSKCLHPYHVFFRLKHYFSRISLINAIKIYLNPISFFVFLFTFTGQSEPSDSVDNDQENISKCINGNQQPMCVCEKERE